MIADREVGFHLLGFSIEFAFQAFRFAIRLSIACSLLLRNVNLEVLNFVDFRVLKSPR